MIGSRFGSGEGCEDLWIWRALQNETAQITARESTTQLRQQFEVRSG
jgi:hypothetical protein